jgi:hypothetical protein|nr:MAG TPA: hypothetical protein [Caudoviricetes sp.]
MTNETSRWDKLNAISHLKAHLKYRDTEASETSANDREKCALKWLFVSLVVETSTVQNTGSVMENNTGSNPERASISIRFQIAN